MKYALYTFVAIVCVLAAVLSFLPQDPPAVHTENWNIVTDQERNITFKYPTDFKTTYIHPQDWPPKIAFIEEHYTCTQAGTETARTGETKQRVINGNTYCVTKVTEGAAGSIYTQYAYAFEKSGKTAIFTFSTRASQCANYPDAQKAECATERAQFDEGAVLDQVAETVVW